MVSFLLYCYIVFELSECSNMAVISLADFLEKQMRGVTYLGPDTALPSTIICLGESLQCSHCCLQAHFEPQGMISQSFASCLSIERMTNTHICLSTQPPQYNAKLRSPSASSHHPTGKRCPCFASLPDGLSLGAVM